MRLVTLLAFMPSWMCLCTRVFMFGSSKGLKLCCGCCMHCAMTSMAAGDVMVVSLFDYRSATCEYKYIMSGCSLETNRC
jgi:hypothetical protein